MRYIPLLAFACSLLFFSSCDVESEDPQIFRGKKPKKEVPPLLVTMTQDTVYFQWDSEENIGRVLEVMTNESTEVLSMDDNKGMLIYPYGQKFTVDPENKLDIPDVKYDYDLGMTEDQMLDHMIGQMLITGIKGTTAAGDPNLMSDIANDKVGGVLIFEKNIDKANPREALTTMISQLKEKTAHLPLMVTIDQEGGKVNRLKEKYGFPKSMTATSLGEIDNTDTTEYYASIMAEVLSEIGVNVNFAPILDLCKEPNNPIITKYGRCFSDDPEEVVEHAIAVVKGHHEHDVLTVVKHFPGHGSSKADSHLGMVDVTDTWGEEELIPFRELINKGYCDAVMTAHIINSNLDTVPATLSQKIQKGILRDDFGFEGVIFSDDMQMKAIAEHYGLKESVYMAIMAGVDVMTFSNNISGVGEQTVESVRKTIRELIDEGRIPKERIKESYDRIVKFKMGFGN